MEKIGNGVHGCVYYDKETGDTIKKSFRNNSDNIWSDNIREMDILRRCGHHPNIVGLNKVSFENFDDPTFNKLTLYLEKFDTDLYSYIESLESHKVNTTSLRLISVQILLGLEYLHTHKIVHRDIKPTNILINPKDMNVSICDFGTCDISMKYKKSDKNVTAPYYRAPEVFSGQQYSYGIDMWSLGLTLYHIIKGKEAYKFPYNEYHKIGREISSLKLNRKNINDREELNKINYQINNLEKMINLAILKSIEMMNIKKDFSQIHDFRSLLVGLLQIDPKKRLTATEALSLPFFNSLRSKYIDKTRKNYPTESLVMRKLSFENILERKWISNYTYKFISEYDTMNTDTLYPILFHGLDLFERYITFQRNNKDNISNTKTTGKYLNEGEVYLYLYTCFYIAHKYYSVTLIPLDYEDFFPLDLLSDYNMKKAEEFEEYLFSHVIDFKIFEYTLYEIAEEMINNPTSSDYFKIIKEYLTITQKDKNYNSYRSLYREHFFKKSTIM